MSEKQNDTKKKVLTVALHLIKEQGYNQVTINDICKASDISKHTFYYYFSSKEELLVEFFTIPRDLSIRNLHSLLSTEHYFDKYWKLIEPTLDFFCDNGIEITKRILIANFNKQIGTFDWSESQKELIETEILLLQKAQEAEEIQNQNDPVALLWITKIQLFGMLSHWAMENGSFDLKFHYRTALENALDVAPHLRKGDFDTIKKAMHERFHSLSTNKNS